MQVNRSLLHSLETVQKMKPIISFYVHSCTYVCVYCTDTRTYVRMYICIYSAYLRTVYADVCTAPVEAYCQCIVSWSTVEGPICPCVMYIRTYVWGLTQCYILEGPQVLNLKEHWRLRNWHQQMWYSDVCVNVYRSSVKTATVCTCIQLKLYCWQGMTHVHSVTSMTLCSLSHKDQVGGLSAVSKAGQATLERAHNMCWLCPITVVGCVYVCNV